MNKSQDSDDEKASFEEMNEFDKDVVKPLMEDSNSPNSNTFYYISRYLGHSKISSLTKYVLIYNKNPELLKTAIKDEEEIKKDKDFDHSALTIASINSKYIGIEPMQLLLNAKISTDGISQSLSTSVIKGFPTIDAVKLLIDAKANVNHKDKFEGNTIIMKLLKDATFLYHINDIGIKYMELLLDAGADITIRNVYAHDCLDYISRNSKLLPCFIKRSGFDILYQIEKKDMIKNVKYDFWWDMVKQLLEENKELKSMKSLIKEVSPLDAMMLQYYM
jgi:ankyrin repeat protein